MPIIFRKTAKGIAEIETRAHRLAPRMRSTLMPVEGNRDADDMRLLVTQQADETLAALLEQGFIEAVGETLRAAAAAATRPVAAPAAVSPTAKPANLESLQRSVVRSLNDELGPRPCGG